MTHSKEELERINKEIEAQLIEEMENQTEEKTRRKIYSVKGFLMIAFLGSAIYRLIHYFI